MKELYQCFKCKTVILSEGEPKHYHKSCGGDWFKVSELDELEG